VNATTMEDLYLKQKRCGLPRINLLMYIPVQSFVSSLLTLLTASDLMKSKNLLFANTENLCYTIHPDLSILREVFSYAAGSHPPKILSFFVH